MIAKIGEKHRSLWSRLCKKDVAKREKTIARFLNFGAFFLLQIVRQDHGFGEIAHGAAKAAALVA
jgi:hypothetical protein